MFLVTDSLQLFRMSDIAGSESPTKRKLIASGEHLLGERGFNGVAMHEIASNAGQSNKYAVQYHFGSMNGLIRAIIDLRRRAVNERRQVLIRQAQERGLFSDPVAQLEVLFLPMAEQVDDHGRHSYARFWIQYLTRAGYDRISDNFAVRVNAVDGPTKHVMQQIRDTLALEESDLYDRIYLQTLVMFGALIDRDNLNGLGHPVRSLDATIEGAITTIAAGLSARLVTDGSDQPAKRVVTATAG